MFDCLFDFYYKAHEAGDKLSADHVIRCVWEWTQRELRIENQRKESKTMAMAKAHRAI